MAGIHRLQHVQGFRTSDLADHQSVGPHPERRDDEVSDRDPLSVWTRWAGLEPSDVALAQLQLGGILDGHDPFIGWDVARQHIEQGRLPASSPAADDDVRSRIDTRLEEAERALAATAQPRQIGHGERSEHELANVEQRPVDRDRWDRDVHA